MGLGQQEHRRRMRPHRTAMACTPLPECPRATIRARERHLKMKGAREQGCLAARDSEEGSGQWAVGSGQWAVGSGQLVP